MSFIVEPNRQDLTEIASRIDRRIVQPVVSRVVPLARACEAFELGAGGHNRGKTVLSIEPPGP